LLLFTASKPNLKATLLDISHAQIQSCCTNTSFQRGSSYQSDGHVSDLELARENELTASVSGSDEYEVSIQQVNQQVMGECDCPYDLSGACKHIVAVLLAAMRNKKTIQSTNPIAEMDIQKMLLTKTKEQLVEWVMDYAPNDFFQRLKHTTTVLEMAKNPTPASTKTPSAPVMESTPATVKQVREAAKSIRALFNDDDLLEDGGKFEKKIMKILNTLRNVWYNEADEINAMLCEVLEKIKEAKGNGQLMDEDDEFDDYEHYDNGQHIFDKIALYEYMKMFAQTLLIEERLFFLQDVNAIVVYMMPTVNISDVFQQSEYPALKKVYLESLKSGEKRIYEDLKAYQAIEFMFSKEEWLSVVAFIYLLDEAICIKLVAHHQNSGENDTAYMVANNYFTNFSTVKPSHKVSENFYDLYITLAQERKQPFAALINQYLTKYSTETTLEKAVNWSPESRVEYEDILKRVSGTNFLQYLENKGRVQEAYNFLNENLTQYTFKNKQFGFLQRHGKQFPKDAIQLFEDTIRENEKTTGDKYYEILTTCILALKEVDKDVAKKWYYYLTSSYSRRPNLLTMLRRIQFL
jgi:uncharacterized Zn finger protein/flavodoxin